MTRPLKRPLYDNILVLAPDGEPLCLCNREKADWYMSRDLAEFIAGNPPLTRLVIRLKFEPKGRGHAGDDFFLAPKSNMCVVCGNNNKLTRHHIVPYCFRRHFSDNVKQHNSHDIVPMCVNCHNKYELHADDLKQKLATQYGVSLSGRNVVLDSSLFRVKRHGSALRGYRDRIPHQRLEILLQTLRNFFNKDDITDQDIERAAHIRPMVKSSEFTKFGEHIVKQVEDLEEFVLKWRKHFLDTMKPAHMPAYWKVDRKIINE